jgi:hypothetical protein
MRFLVVGVLLLAAAGCGRSKCTSSAECNGGYVCGAPHDQAFQCLHACATDADCGAGTACEPVSSADCTECGEDSALACVAAATDAAGQ